MKFILALLFFIGVAIAAMPTTTQMYDNTLLRFEVPKTSFVGASIYVTYNAWYYASTVELKVGVNFVYSSLLSSRKISLYYSNNPNATESQVTLAKTFSSDGTAIIPLYGSYDYFVYLWFNASCDLSVLSSCNTITTDVSLFFVDNDVSNTLIYSPTSTSIRYPLLKEGYSTPEYTTIHGVYNYFEFTPSHTSSLPVQISSSVLSTFTDVSVMGSDTIYPTTVDGTYAWMQNAHLVNHSFTYGTTTHIGVAVGSSITGTASYSLCIACSLSSTVVLSSFILLISLLLSLF
jgi:hypothetical protein